MTKRRLKFVKTKIHKDKVLGPNKKGLIIDIKKENFTFKPYRFKPEESWEIARIIFSFDKRNDLYNKLKTNLKFELVYEDDDKEVWFDDGSPHGGGVSTDLRVFHKNAVTSSIGSGLIECDFTSNNDDKIKLEIENEIPFDPPKVRQQAIQHLKQLWKDNSSDGTETGAINGKSIAALLGTNWEKEFNNKNTREEIGQHEQQLDEKIRNLIGSQLIKIVFTKKSHSIITDDEARREGLKKLNLKLEEPVDLTFYCSYRKQNLT